MRFKLLPTLLGLPFIGPALVQGTPFPGRIIQDTDLLPVYDYVIVGGGVSGLVVANRLTEDPKTTVLVIEAGKIDNYSPAIQYPRHVSLAPVNNSWPITSLPDAKLNNRTTPVEAARLLGGGSAINGMAFDRGSPGDYDLWAELIGDERWGWEGLLPYFKKSETFTPPTEDLQKEFGIGYDMDVHGTTGPVQSSFPPFITTPQSMEYGPTYCQTLLTMAEAFISALRQLGIPIQVDGTANAIGGFWSPNSLDPVSRERSYARTYHELATDRRNYHVLLESLVTRLTPDLSSVEYIPGYPALNATPPGIKYQVQARKEIILAAGAIHTPKVLQLSGIGSSQALDNLGIKPIIDLPAVGENFQDHPALYGSEELTNLEDPTQLLSYVSSNATYDAEQGVLYDLNRTGRWTASWENTLSFLTATHLNLSVSLARLATHPAERYLRPGLDPTLVNGYKKVQRMTLEYARKDKIALTENLLGGIVSLQKPFSRGTVLAASPDPHEMPVVEYRAFTNPLDLQILIQGIRFNTDILPTTDAYKALGTIVQFPTPGLSDTELAAVIQASASPTLDHACGTCAMLKFEDGGCVDNNLVLYGSNGRIRVVDASVIPVVPSAHIQSTVYAVAEKAADLIRGRY